MEIRVSSTPIGTILDCRRKFVFDLAKSLDLDSGAIQWGSLFHLGIEAYLETARPGDVLHQKELAGIMRSLPPGDYGDDSHLLEDEELWDEVYAHLVPVMEWDYTAKLLNQPTLELEYDLTQFKVEIGDRPQIARGRVDYLYRNEDGILVLGDWKTRGDLSYAPYTDKDFREFPQTAYYGCVWHKYRPEPNGLIIEHCNVIRGNEQEPIRYWSHYPPEYLEKMFRYFDNHLVPMMEKDAAKDPLEVPRDEKSCFRYGKCRYYNECPAQKLESSESFLSVGARLNRMKILSEEAPDEVEPTPVPEKSISVLDGMGSRVTSNFQELDVATLRDLQQYIMGGNLLTDVAYVGPKTAKRIVFSLYNYYAEYPDVDEAFVEKLSAMKEQFNAS